MNDSKPSEATNERQQKTCPEVVDHRNGSVVQSAQLFERLDEGDQFKERMAVEELRLTRRPRYACPLCGRALSLRGGFGFKVTLYFAHPREPEHLCPYKTGSDHTPAQLAAMKYNGLKETRLHRQLKAWIWLSLCADSSIEHETVRTERRMLSKLPDGGFRRPDVTAIWHEQSLVFEAQLASTFVTVIAQRRIFYRTFGAHLIWVFPSWPETAERFMSKDVYYNNNFNVFVVNEQTVARSIAKRTATLEVWWADPEKIDSDGRATHWFSRLAGLDELSFDPVTQRVFLVDVEKLRSAYKSREKLNRIAEMQALQIKQGIDSRVPPFSSLAFSFGQHSTDAASSDNAIPYLTEAADNLFGAILSLDTATLALQLRWFSREESTLSSRDVVAAFANAKMLTVVRDRDAQEATLQTLLLVLFSLQAGAPITEKYKNLRQMENLIFSSYRRHFRLFLRAAERWDRNEVLGANDPKSTISRHRNQFRTDRNNKLVREKTLQDRSFDRLIAVVFPDLESDINELASSDADFAEKCKATSAQ